MRTILINHLLQSITTIAIYLIVLLQFKLSLIQEQSFQSSLQQSLLAAALAIQKDTHNATV